MVGFVEFKASAEDADAAGSNAMPGKKIDESKTDQEAKAKADRKSTLLIVHENRVGSS